MVEARLYLEGSGACKVSHALTYLLDHYPPRLKGKGIRRWSIWYLSHSSSIKHRRDPRASVARQLHSYDAGFGATNTTSQEGILFNVQPAT